MSRTTNPISYLFCCLITVASILTGQVSAQTADNPGKIRIIYSNDTLGYLEPCGCGGRYLGGLSRRATAISRLVQENPNVVIVDSGDIANRRANLSVILSIMAAMKYDAVGIGAIETYYMDDFLKCAQSCGLKVITAMEPASKTVVSYYIKQMDGMKVGVVSYGKDNADTGSSPDALHKFYAAYDEAKRRSDLLVLLDQGGIATSGWLKADADGHGAPGIVIAGTINMALSKEIIVGKTHIVPTSLQGKHVGVIDIHVSSDRSLTMAVGLVKIDKDTPEDETVRKQIADFLKKPALSPAQGSGATGVLPTGVVTNLGNGMYYSPETCEECHPDQYEEWAKTNDASAVSTLASKDRMIADCLPCHSEEYRQTLRTTRKPSASKPTGVECATCHSSVLPHGEDGPNKFATRRVDPKLCISCHNAERSPDYNQESYLPKVTHFATARK